MKNKKIKFILGILIILVVVVVIGTFISISKFGVSNPFKTAIGLTQIMFTETNYVQIQDKPRVIVSKSNNAYNLFLDTMKSEGYTYLEDEQMGSMLVFEKDGVREEVFFSVNAYFSKWKWNK